ncbi:hypothetical protein M9H77_13230 [Catharanthus roseus]|uniref:Uncharacterized protein n=1 Tax=Catharanthus roseus TaxID=4058 RepID=A0ACC0BJS4_CATRO|nr:hypothetical protein M9H77_13230 [Catharanthus roseus]
MESDSPFIYIQQIWPQSRFIERVQEALETLGQRIPNIILRRNTYGLNPCNISSSLWVMSRFQDESFQMRADDMNEDGQRDEEHQGPITRARTRRIKGKDCKKTAQ